MAALSLNLASYIVLPMKVRDLLVLTKMAPSKSQADRLLSQGAVTVKHSREEDPEEIKDGKVYVPVNAPFFLRVGKRWTSPVIKADLPTINIVVEDVKELEG